MIVKFIIELVQLIRIQHILNKVYEEEQIILRLSELIGSQVRRDWLGRLYVVINPMVMHGELNKDVLLNISETGTLVNEEYIQAWLFGRLNILSQFIKTQNLFDILTYTLKKLDDSGNYLLVLQPINLMKTIKNGLWATIEVIILIAIFIYGYQFYTR